MCSSIDSAPHAFALRSSLSVLVLSYFLIERPPLKPKRCAPIRGVAVNRRCPVHSSHHKHKTIIASVQNRSQTSHRLFQVAAELRVGFGRV